MSVESQSEAARTDEPMLRQLDRLLRGELTRPEDLRGGTLPVSVERLALAVLLLGMIYGACMGCYALFDSRGVSVAQFLTTVGKVPLLFVLTVFVTFPSLYVFNALVGSNLGLMATARLVAAALAVMLAILASLGPIVAFFSLSTTGYHFMLLLNVVVFTVAGLLGLRFLLTTLRHLIYQAEEEALNATSALNDPVEAAAPVAAAAPAAVKADAAVTTASPAAPVPVPESAAPASEAGAAPPASAAQGGGPEPAAATLQTSPAVAGTMPAAPAGQPPAERRELTSRDYDLAAEAAQAAQAAPRATRPESSMPHRVDRSAAVSRVFYIWIAVFGLVGAQMAWVMRPFLGHPGGEFVLVRLRQSNFFEAMVRVIEATFGG